MKENRDLFKELKNLKGKIFMPKADKEALFSRLMDEVEKTGDASGRAFGVFPFYIFGFGVPRSAAYAIASFLIMMLIGGTAIAAENSVPGNLLYPIKTNVNEAFIGFAKSGTSAASWQAERASRRLEEAEELVASGKLDENKSEKLGKMFKEHAESFDKSVTGLDQSDKLTLISLEMDFEAKISAHSRILEHLERYSDENQKEKVRELVNDVKKRIAEKEPAMASAAAASGAPSSASVLPDKDVSGRFEDGRNEKDEIENEKDPFEKDSLEVEDGSEKEEIEDDLLFEEHAKRIESYIKETEDKYKEVSNNFEMEGGFKREIVNDARESIDNAKRLLEEAGKARGKSVGKSANDETVKSLFKSERAAKEADISLKRGIKIRFNK